MFYHQNGPDDFHRQICVEEFKYTSEGLIPPVHRTKEGPGKVELRIDALGDQEAEVFQQWSDWGLECVFEPTGEGNRVINVLAGNTWIMFRNVDFGSGVKYFESALSSPLKVQGGAIELRINKPVGDLIGECDIPKTSVWYDWQKSNCSITTMQKVYIIYTLFFRGIPKRSFTIRLILWLITLGLKIKN